MSYASSLATPQAAPYVPTVADRILTIQSRSVDLRNLAHLIRQKLTLRVDPPTECGNSPEGAEGLLVATEQNLALVSEYLNQVADQLSALPIAPSCPHPGNPKFGAPIR